jgi:Predicted periplasmic solute-binding protein
VDSPYNTRKYGGLPPGPISSVSQSALEAAFNPAKTDYIYYVLNVEKNDGSHHFFSSAADFERAKAQYQRWLEEQRKIKKAQEANK